MCRFRRELRYLHGNRRSNIELANKLFSSEINIKFIKIEEESIDLLMHLLKKLNSTVKSYYEYDELLFEQTDDFISQCRKVVGSIADYKNFFEKIDADVTSYFTFTKKKIYKDLFEEYIKPIIEVIKVLRRKESNAYLEGLERLQVEYGLGNKNTYIITKQKTEYESLNLNNNYISMLSAKEFLEKGIFAKYILFLGTPGYYDQKFSEVFYGENVFFLGYSCFENRLIKRNVFSNIVGTKDIINTLYKNVEMSDSFSGINYKDSIQSKIDSKSEEVLVEQYEKAALFDIQDAVEVKFVRISNNNYIFLPLTQKVNIIERDTLKILTEYVKDLQIGDLLVFRSHNASNLIKEVADKILGDDAKRFRLYVEGWKRRLRINVERKGVQSVSRILKIKYKINEASENNVKNWISEDAFNPYSLDRLLYALKFDEQEIIRIIEATKKIVSAHISAGRKISRDLMNELDEGLESLVDVHGFYTFKSRNFEDSYFNIEIIKSISNKTYFVQEKEVMKIIKK